MEFEVELRREATDAVDATLNGRQYNQGSHDKWVEVTVMMCDVAYCIYEGQLIIFKEYVD